MPFGITVGKGVCTVCRRDGRRRNKSIANAGAPLVVMDIMSHCRARCAEMENGTNGLVTGEPEQSHAI
jgi:hypothetical protein